MCGLAGYLSHHVQADSVGLLQKMGEAIVHRGPDDEGTWFDHATGIGLAHRRLSIIDLSAAGHQPMHAISGRYVLALNGEIYNHAALKRELEETGYGRAWCGHSDTEVVLAGFEAWGVEATLVKSIGMFAMAIWDKQQQTLILCRDRLGEKPLYYGWQGDTFLFGSELKALKVHPAFQAEIDRDALALMMRYNNVPTPYSIYQGIQKLLPGTLLTVSLANRTPTFQRYWDLRKVVENGIALPFHGSPQEAVDALDVLLKEAVAQQMVADVPLGAFLSGGVDSSTLVALMQAQSKRPVRTFTIGFHETNFNEAEYAKAVAKHLGTDHTELYVSGQLARDVIPSLPHLYCEPFADLSQIPTFLVSQMARRHVTVSLSGDGGDELFNGYERYRYAKQYHDKLSPLPMIVRKSLASLMTGLSPTTWNQIADAVPFVCSNNAERANFGNRIYKVAGLMRASTSAELYRIFISHWINPQTIVLGAVEPSTVMTDSALQPKTDHFDHQMMALDMLNYLTDDILAKVDRAAMGVSLETRVPLLDHRVVEFAWRLPLAYKLQKGVGKWALRQVLYKYVPQALIDRPKMGFTIPMNEWLRGPLRDWAEVYLDESRLRQEGYFNHTPIRKMWADHLSGKGNWQFHLWNVLMFQAWLEGQSK